MRELVRAIDAGVARLRGLRANAPVARYLCPGRLPPGVHRLAMLQPVSVAQKHLSDYASIVGRPLVDEIRERAERLKGKRILHVSATAFGGGVAEILYTLVPLMADVGLEVEWQVIYGREEFFNATKVMHNALQGNPQDLTEEQWDIWFRYNEINARELSDGWDVCIVHDPQPAALCSLVGEKSRHWVWRCHIDLSTPNAFTLERLLPYLDPYPAAVFHIRAVRAEGDGRARTHRPACDRPAGTEEHGLLARGRRLHLRPVRDRRRPAAAVPGVPVRSVEGPAGRDRRVPAGQGGDPRRTVGAGRLDGYRRSRRMGLLQRHRGACRRRSRYPHPQQPQ